jgi:DnaJ domain
MFVKRKQRPGHGYFFLCIAERGGTNGNNGKVMEYSVSLGETLNLSSTRWLEVLKASKVFRSIPLEDVLKVVEKYVAKHGLASETVVGLREAANGAHRQKAGRRVSKEQRTAVDEYENAFQLLGLPQGSSENDIESAFRKSVRLHHPDVGGDSTKFRALVAARNLLLRLTQSEAK